MKTKTMTLLILLTTLLYSDLSSARIGSETGNGGASVACRDSQGQLTSVDLLDLYEGFALYGHGYTELESAAEEQARSYIPEIDRIFGVQGESESLVARLNSIISSLHLLPSGVGLKPTEDLGNFIVPKDCAIVQAINFRDD